MAHIDDESRPTAQPSGLPLSEPAEPPLHVLLPNLDRVSASSFHRGSLSRRRIVAAMRILAGVAVLTTLLVLFADVIFANLGTVLSWALVVVVAVSMIGLVLILRDEQNARRATRDTDD
jgi:hypothetical protein